MSFIDHTSGVLAQYEQEASRVQGFPPKDKQGARAGALKWVL